MYYRDDNPPHFPAQYSEYEALIDISSLELLSGSLPSRVFGLVIEWASIHKEELMNNWEKAIKQEALLSIKPLV